MSETFLFVILGAAVLGVMICVWMHVRNEQVAKFRISIINFAFEDRTDYHSKNQWYRALPDYNAMLNRPWRPLDSFLTGPYADDFRAWQKRQSA